MENKGKRLQILIMEYEKCYDKVLYIDGQGNKAIENFFIALGVLMAFGVYILSNWINEPATRILAFFFIDMGIFILNFLLIYAFHIMVLCFRAGGYMLYLEEKINIELADNLLCWEEKIAPKLVHSGNTSVVIMILVGMLFLIFSVGSIIICVNEILFTQYWYFACIIFVLMISEFIGVVVIAKEASVAHQRSYKISKSSKG